MVEHELALPHVAPDHDYVVHNADLPLPQCVADIDFDGIVLCQTFLSQRRDPRSIARVRQVYDFIRRSPAVKIALPQDDYDCGAILDHWMSDWGVHRVYPVVTDHWDVVYPRFRTQGELKQGFTGYLSQAMLSEWPRPKPFGDRQIDVSYRAARLTPNYGRLGYLKGVIGDRFMAAAAGRGLRLDVSTAPAATIAGPAWRRFLENSRFVLGVNSGSSLWDPNGHINLRVDNYLVRHPRASFEEVEAACFPGEDGRFSFTALSPRNIECAVLECAQVLTAGPYGGVLAADDHYLTMAPDLSNADDLFRRMADRDTVGRTIRAAKEAIVSVPELRLERHVSDVLETIAHGIRPGRSSSELQGALIARHRREVEANESTFWTRHRHRRLWRERLARLGARRLKRMLTRTSVQ